MWSEPARGLADRLEGSTTVNAPHTFRVWGALWSGASEHVGESAASDDASRVVPDLLQGAARSGPRAAIWIGQRTWVRPVSRFRARKVWGVVT